MGWFDPLTGAWGPDQRHDACLERCLQPSALALGRAGLLPVPPPHPAHAEALAQDRGEHAPRPLRQAQPAGRAAPRSPGRPADRR